MLFWILRKKKYWKKMKKTHIKNEMKLVLIQSMSTPYIHISPAHKLLQVG